jgi:hypothetical protein
MDEPATPPTRSEMVKGLASVTIALGYPLVAAWVMNEIDKRRKRGAQSDGPPPGAFVPRVLAGEAREESATPER